MVYTLSNNGFLHMVLTKLYNHLESNSRKVTLRAKNPIRPHPFYAVHLGISNIRLYIQLGRSTRVFREYKFPTRVKLYIH